MKRLKYWLSAWAVSGAAKKCLQRLVVQAGGRAPVGVMRLQRDPRPCERVVAVVKVTPPRGCVKYKAQHVVLAVRIPLFIVHSHGESGENGQVGCGKRPESALVAGFTGWLTGAKSRVGGTGAKSKVQERCNGCGSGWKCGKGNGLSKTIPDEFIELWVFPILEVGQEGSSIVESHLIDVGIGWG